MKTEQMQMEWPWLSSYETHPQIGNARPVICEHGIVSTPHHQATLIGLDVLRAGGNAVDAAIGASAALMVTVPMQCSPGGDAMWLVRHPTGRIEALDGSGRSAAAASASVLRDKGQTTIGHRSALSVTVPGAVDSWVEAGRRYATKTLGELLEPAAVLAERGFFVSRHMHASFMAGRHALEQWKSLSLYSANGGIPQIHERLRQPALANSLREIARTEGKALYEGKIGEAIIAAIAEAGGLLSMEDLRSHRSDWVKPLKGAFRQSTIYTTPPATQGVALLQALATIQSLLPEPVNISSAADCHILVEAVAEALHDRDRHICDRDLMTVDPARLYGMERVGAIAKSISTTAKRRSATTVSTKGRGDTAHLAVVDRDGWAVSLIQSLYFDFGSGIGVPSAGFTLQNRGAAFSLEPDVANELKPGKRPPHTLTPTMICQGDQLTHAMGCMGGDGQVQTQLQLITGMIDAGLDPQQAISRPRWYLDRANSSGPQVMVEAGFDPSILAELRQRGHDVSVLGPAEEVMGHAQVISVTKEGVLVGGADPRSDGQAAGW